MSYNGISTNMSYNDNTDNVILKTKYILIIPDGQFDHLESAYKQDLEYIRQNFCGIVCTDLERLECSSDNTLYILGNIESIYDTIFKHLSGINIIRAIKELSYNYSSNSENYSLVNFGEVPINIHNVGIYFRRLFSDDIDYFSLIRHSHQFQTLTESTKPGRAFRTGIYLTD